MSANKRPLISFIITYYNLPTDMLVKCTDSILALPLGNDDREIILIDDGSDTSPLNALDERNKLIKYIRQQNAGLSAARNKGIEAAQGDYIQFVDGDDMLLTEPYKQCLDIIRQDKPDMLMFKMTNDNKHYHIDEGHNLRTNGAQYMTRHNLRASACGYVFKRNILNGLRFPIGILHEDEDFTPRLMLNANSLYVIRTTAYFYRERRSSITHSIDETSVSKRLDDVNGIITSLSRTAEKLNGAKKDALERRTAQLTMDYIYNTIRLTKSSAGLEARLDKLKAGGLFPLPKRYYTLKYFLFRSMTTNKTTRRILKHLLS